MSKAICDFRSYVQFEHALYRMVSTQMIAHRLPTLNMKSFMPSEARV